MKNLVMQKPSDPLQEVHGVLLGCPSLWQYATILVYWDGECYAIVWIYLCMNHLMTKPAKWQVCPAKNQISLGIRPVWSESSLCAQWVAETGAFFMWTAKPLIRLGGCPGWSESLLGAYAIFLVLSWGCSYLFWYQYQSFRFVLSLHQGNGQS